MSEDQDSCPDDDDEKNRFSFSPVAAPVYEYPDSLIRRLEERWDVRDVNIVAVSASIVLLSFDVSEIALDIFSWKLLIVCRGRCDTCLDLQGCLYVLVRMSGASEADKRSWR